MRKDIIRSAIVIVVATVVLGLIYPAVMVAVGQVAFPNQANGSLITRERQDRRLEAGRPVASTAPATSTSARRRSPTTPTARASRTSGPNSKALAGAREDADREASSSSRGRTTPA